VFYLAYASSPVVSSLGHLFNNTKVLGIAQLAHFQLHLTESAKAASVHLLTLQLLMTMKR